MAQDFKHMTADKAFDTLKNDILDKSSNPGELQHELHGLVLAHSPNDNKFWKRVKDDLDVSHKPFKGAVNFSGVDIQTDEHGNLLGIVIKSPATGDTVAKIVPSEEQFDRQHKQYENHLAQIERHAKARETANENRDQAIASVTPRQHDAIVDKCLQDIPDPEKVAKDITDQIQTQGPGQQTRLLEELETAAREKGMPMHLNYNNHGTADEIVWKDGHTEHAIFVPDYAYPARVER